MKKANATGGPAAAGVASWADEATVPKATPPSMGTSNTAAKSTEIFDRNIVTSSFLSVPVGICLIVAGSPGPEGTRAQRVTRRASPPSDADRRRVHTGAAGFTARAPSSTPGQVHCPTEHTET